MKKASNIYNMNKATHLKDKLSEKTYLRPYVVVFSASLFFFFESIQLNMFNSLNLELMEAFNIGSTELGKLSATYFYGTILFLFPAGIMLDRISTKKIIIVTMLLCIGCTLLFSLSSSIWQANLYRFITGIGGSFTLLSSVRLASRWFPPDKMALIVGLIVTFAMLGGLVAQIPLTLLVLHFGWRATLVLDSTWFIVFSNNFFLCERPSR